ncbi:MAG: hypothetical protein P0Y60_01265 [Candidatus Microbacterium colombiense]|nr:MAG: hypothetical protein P0Y60_01265 [Microbacterium sp.]
MNEFGEPPSRVSVGDGLMAAHVFVAVIGGLYVLSMIMNVDGCSDRCDYPTLEYATRAFWTLDLTVLLGGSLAYVLLPSRTPRAWLVPGIGVAITAVALVVTIIAIDSALVLG